jgi:hypothetical protein
MIYYSGFNTGRIVSCFNSTLTLPANTTPPCGFTATKFGTGDYGIDLGWKVDNRFFSVGGGNAANTMCTDTNGAHGCAGTTVNANQVEVLTRTWASGGLFDTKFYLIVY